MNVLKWHYLLWFGCLSGVLSYVPIFAKEHTNATATDVGILYTILPFVASIIKPIFCSFADRFNAHKKIAIIFLSCTLLGYGLLLTVPFVKFGAFTWYWFCLLALLANSSMGIVISLTDFMVMKEVTEKNKTFGSYRIFGTIGWGSFGLFAGYINENIRQIPYLTPGLIMFMIILTLDILCIIMKYENNNEHDNGLSITDEENILNVRPEIKIGNNSRGKNRISLSLIPQIGHSLYEIFSKVSETFRKYPSLFQYVLIITIFGILTAFHWSFYFWYIEEIRGKDPLLMGLCLFVQCFIGEVPFFLISHHIVNYFGHAISLNIGLSLWGIRYLAYGYLLTKGESYWDVLIVEVSQGPTFSLFYCVMTSLANSYADKANSDSLQMELETSTVATSTVANAPEPKAQNTSTHATMQGIMSGCYEGLGLGIGSLVGGYVIDISGVFVIWRYAAFFALGTIVVNSLIEIIKRIRNT